MPPFRPRRALRPIRPRLTRRALAWYACAITLACVTGFTVHGALSRAADAEAAYGRSRPVVIVRRAVEAGETLTAADTEVRSWPLVMVSDDVLTEPPTGHTALVALLPGEALRAERVSPRAGESGTALLDPDRRAVAVPVAVPGLSLRPGDRVDVLGRTVDGGGPDGDLPVGEPRPSVVATDARVVRARRETVVLAVDVDDAADLAAAVTAGPVVLALRPPGS